MGLSSDLISQFVKATKSTDKTKKETTVYGTTVEYNGKTYVRLDGSDRLTPVSTTADIKPDERVTVMIKNHTATVTGNISSPAARTDDVKDAVDQISEFEIIVSHVVSTDELNAITATIENLRATVAEFEDVEIVNAEIEKLEALFIDSEHLTATDIKAIEAQLEKLEATFGEFTDISTEDLEAINADIGTLKAYTAEFTYVSTEVLEALKADIKNLDVEKLSAKDADLKYVNIDFGKIDKAWMKEFYVQSGLIENVVVGDETVTGYLVGVTIKGDLIEGGTVVADKLVIKGEDGLYYKLNTTGITDATFTDGYVKTNQTINVVEGSAVDGAFVFTEYPVYSYIDEDENSIYYCVINDVYYKVDADTEYNVYNKTTEVVEPVEGSIVNGAYITVDSQVYSYSDGEGNTTHYCVVDDVYYQVAVETNSVKVEQTEYNSLHGSIITAGSITATQIHVEDLVAFDATIGGFHITDTALYSGVKETIGNTTQGVYMDREGQMALGDSSNFIKYYRDEDGSYKLHISAESILFSNGDDIANLLEYIKIRPDDGSITLGGKNGISLTLDNDRISFEKDGEPFGHWDGENFNTGNIKVNLNERAQFGNFAFVPRTDGSLSFLKVEHNSGVYATVNAEGVMYLYGVSPTLEDTTMVIPEFDEAAGVAITSKLDGTTLIIGGS